jgi:hypothetical protein
MARKKLNSINDLIIFSLYSMPSGKSTFEKLVNECFKNFPLKIFLKFFPLKTIPNGQIQESSTDLCEVCAKKVLLLVSRKLSFL